MKVKRKLLDIIIATSLFNYNTNNLISGIFHRYLELKKCRPKVSKLRSLLQKSPYFGPSSAADGGITGMLT